MLNRLYENTTTTGNGLSSRLPLHFTLIIGVHKISLRFDSQLTHNTQKTLSISFIAPVATALIGSTR